jgi:4a-hydroxytetrahydrobiopterin dehydratase
LNSEAGKIREISPSQSEEENMSDLTEQKCVACRADAPKVTEAETTELKPEIPDWELAEHDGIPWLSRVFSFPNFAGALAFTNRVGDLAEEEGHHPAILTEWGRVTVSWWTHKIRGLHRNDFIMAAKTDRIYAGS